MSTIPLFSINYTELHGYITFYYKYFGLVSIMHHGNLKLDNVKTWYTSLENNEKFCLTYSSTDGSVFVSYDPDTKIYKHCSEYWGNDNHGCTLEFEMTDNQRKEMVKNLSKFYLDWAKV
jgi:hypothetical protein